MPRIDNEQFYLSALKKYGISAKGVNWLSKQSQEIRFDILLSLLPPLKEKIIADAGCGFGDFYNYLKTKHAIPKQYIGIDTVIQMCQHAIKNTNDNNTTIMHKDILLDTLPKADYYISSGALNILHPYESFVFIRNCFNASNEGFAFNILHGDKQSDTYNYITKKQIDNYAKELNVSNIITKEGYIQSDITVMFVK